MRIRMRTKRQRLDRIALNLAPMIDVTFLLLIYFMVSTVFTPSEDQLSPNLGRKSKEGAASRQDFVSQRVIVASDPSAPSAHLWKIGRRTLRERSGLETLLRDLPKNAGLIVEVEDGVAVSHAVTVMQIAHDVGFTEVSYVPAD